jgi:hypothetical protein
MADGLYDDIHLSSIISSHYSGVEHLRHDMGRAKEEDGQHDALRRILDRMTRALSGVLPTGFIDPFPWIVPSRPPAGLYGYEDSPASPIPPSFSNLSGWYPYIRRLIPLGRIEEHY